MGSIFARGNRLYAKAKGVDGKWRQLPTDFVVGEEAKARKWVAGLDEKVDATRAAGATGELLTLRAYAKPWIAKREQLALDWRNDEQRLRTHVFPALGNLRLNEIRPRHLTELFEKIRAEKKIAPRTIYNVYSVLSALFRDARLADLIEQTPCILTSYQLGPLVDKDSTQRGNAVFGRDEIEKLIGDSRIPIDRQLVYAFGALAGLRHGEIAGLRWHHYDAAKEPLGQLTIATSYNKGHTKTGVTRRVPAHAVLAAMLAGWKLHGWREMVGRDPAPDDLIVPLPHDEPNKRARTNPRAGGMRSDGDSRIRLIGDLDTLELRHRRGHDLRATFITLAEDDGADPNILAKLTHTARGRSAYSGYSRTQWDTLCREVAKLKIARVSRGNIIALPLKLAVGDTTPRDQSGSIADFGAALVQSKKTLAITASKTWGWRDSNPHALANKGF